MKLLFIFFNILFSQANAQYASYFKEPFDTKYLPIVFLSTEIISHISVLSKDTSFNRYDIMVSID